MNESKNTIATPSNVIPATPSNASSSIKTPSNATPAKSDNNSLNEGLNKIEKNQQNSSNNASNKEYVTSGAILHCGNGSLDCVLQLPESHGYYAQNRALIDVNDSGPDNISGFGVCKKDHEACQPELIGWIDGDENTRIWDNNTLNTEATVMTHKSFCLCRRGGAFVTSVSSGQLLDVNSADVYITGDRKAIVVKGISYDIYNPHNPDNSENWFTLMPYRMTEVEFSLSKALTGVDLNIDDYFRKEIVTFSNQSIEFGNGKVKLDSVQNTFVSSAPRAGSNQANTISQLQFISLAKNILQSFANAITYTTLYFYFQKSESNKHRVVIMGGTNTDYWKYANYGYYNMYVSYLDFIVPSELKLITKKGMKKTIKDLIDLYLDMINAGTSKATLLVEKSELELIGNEYYDMMAYISPKRRYKKHHIYLYEENKNMHQKYISWPKESLVIVKRRGIIPFETTTKLIELINDTGTLEGNHKYWEIFQNVLVENFYTSKYNVANPSNATYSIANIEDIIPTSARIQDISDLESMEG